MNQALNKFKGKRSENSSLTGRLPPGQFETKQFPILDLGVRPEIDKKDFVLSVEGDIENPFEITWNELTRMNSKTITADFHCVTRWSRFDLTWTGVPLRDIVDKAKPVASVEYVIFGSRDGYTTNVHLEDCRRENVIVAYKLEGEDIPLIHGGPVRMIIPHLYGWKSAKFLNSIKFSNIDEPGFWEVRGYHNYGDPWKEQRYSA